MSQARRLLGLPRWGWALLIVGTIAIVGLFAFSLHRFLTINDEPEVTYGSGTYQVGVDIPAGDYEYTGGSGDPWLECDDPACDSVKSINILFPPDEGTLTIPSDARYVQIPSITLTPA